MNNMFLFKYYIINLRGNKGVEYLLIIKLEKKLKEQNLKNPTKKIANLEHNKISKSKKPFPQEVKSQFKNENQNKIYCSICGHDIPKYMPMYFSGEKYNPACEDCKASDSSWALMTLL